MTDKDKDRIKCAIRHIKSSLDVDTWAMEIAVDAMQRMMNADGDLISRQAAIDAIFSEPLYEPGMKKRDADAVVPAIYEKIKSLPSAQPEQKTGQWMEAVEDWRHQIVWWKCSGCGTDVSTMYKYCPYCGLEMRGEEDG